MMADDIAERLAELTMQAQFARTNGAPAVADEIDRQMHELVLEAQLRGQIENQQALFEAVVRHTTELFWPHLSDTLGLPELLRGTQRSGQR
jgi:hypothetical protein